MIPILDKGAALRRMMEKAVKVSDNGLRLIAEFEGFAGYLYNDPVGHATVGYGFLVHTGNYHEQRGVCGACDRWPRRREPRETWLTAEKGRELLAEKVKAYADAVERTTRPLNQNEFDALTSLCFNVGPGGYLNSSVRMAVNKGGDVCGALRQIVRGTDGVVYPGLVRRREAECVLFFTKPKPVVEEEDVKPILVWNKDKQQTWFVGPFGAVPIIYPPDATALEALYGKHATALSDSTLRAMVRT